MQRQTDQTDQTDQDSSAKHAKDFTWRLKMEAEIAKRYAEIELLKHDIAGKMHEDEA